MKQKAFFVLAIIFALVAAGAVYLFLEDLEQNMKEDQDYAAALVARSKIPPRTVVTADMMERIDVPLSQLRSDALQNKDEIIGSTTKVPLYAGEPFLADKLASPDELGSGLAYTIAPGKRAMSVQVNEVIGVAQMVLPGDQVDVIAVLEKESEDKRVKYSTLVVQDIRVLAVNQVLATDEPSLAACTVTLELSPVEAQSLLLADETGKIRLLLRGTTESSRTVARPFKADDF